MIAADGIAAVLRTDRWRQLLTRANLLVVAFVVVAIGGECHGHARGVEAARSAMADSVRHVLADSSRVIEARIASRAPSILATAQTMIATRAKLQAARAHVAIVADTVLLVDSVLVHVPMPVVQIIARCDSMPAADSIAYHVVVAQLEDVTKDRDVWRARAELDEATVPPKHRLGFRSGAVVGAAVVALLVYLIK
jgi:hypothetical protein